MATKEMKRYRLLRGLHQTKDAEGKSVTYNARDPAKNIVESTTDLEKKFGADKYQSLERLASTPSTDALQRRIAQLEMENAKLKKRSAPEAAEAEEEEDEPEVELETDEGQIEEDDPYELKTMTAAELRKFAKEMEIDLGTATRKDEITNTIQSALDAR